MRHSLGLNGSRPNLQLSIRLEILGRAIESLGDTPLLPEVRDQCDILSATPAEEATLFLYYAPDAKTKTILSNIEVKCTNVYELRGYMLD